MVCEELPSYDGHRASEQHEWRQPRARYGGMIGTTHARALVNDEQGREWNAWVCQMSGA